MWSRNAFSERLKLKWPILQAPMGEFTTPALAAAVSNAGGLGGLGMWGFSAEDAARRVAGFRQQSGGSLNVASGLGAVVGGGESNGAEGDWSWSGVSGSTAGPPIIVPAASRSYAELSPRLT